MIRSCMDCWCAGSCDCITGTGALCRCKVHQPFTQIKTQFIPAKNLWQVTVHITNHHYHLHITLFYTTQDMSQPTQPHTTYNISHTTIQLHTSTTHMLNHMVMQVSCRLMQIPCRLSCSHMYSLPLSLLYVAVHQSPDPWSELFSFYDLTFWQAV